MPNICNKPKHLIAIPRKLYDRLIYVKIKVDINFSITVGNKREYL
jgi:hypothetical protein